MKTLAKDELKRFNYLISEIGELYHEASVCLGISDSIMQILYTLYVYGDQCQLKDIARLSGMSRQTINSSIRILEKKDMLYLKYKNGKNKLVCLTDKGYELLTIKIEPLVKIENQIFDEWDEKERNAFLDSLQKYHNFLKGKLLVYFNDSKSNGYKNND